MEILAGLSVGVLVYLAFAFDVAGFMARDELLWRGLMLTASAFYLVYYYFVVDEPLWDAILTNGVLAGVNLFVMFIVLAERSTFGMSHSVIGLYRNFPMLSPGQFRKLLKAGETITAADETVLIQEGEPATHLFYVLDGHLEIGKNERQVQIAPNTFVAEIAFLTEGVGSATVSVTKGSRFIQWDADKLRALLEKNTALQTGLMANINMDLAHKVAKSVPSARLHSSA